MPYVRNVRKRSDSLHSLTHSEKNLSNEDIQDLRLKVCALYSFGYMLMCLLLLSFLLVL